MARKKRTSSHTPQQLVHPHAAGIDCGATAHFVAVPNDRDPQPVRSFGTCTADLQALADWLEQCGIETVAMESTGVYWIPLFELLEARGITAYLVDPGKIKHAPGRKTDVVDCQWIQQLHSCGLLSASFRPAEDLCILRSYMRQRDMLVRYAAQHIQHMQKALTEMNVQLHHGVDDLLSMTGTRIITAILAGERDPATLARFRDERCKQDEATIARALQGNWRADHLFALQQAYDLYQFYHGQLARVDARVEACLRTFADKSEGRPRPKRPGARQRKPTRNEPTFEVSSLLYQMTGVDLTTIDGIGPHLALSLISEIGIDMSPWKSDKHFASWLCLAPGNHKSGGKQRRSKSGTRPSANRAAGDFRLAAFAVSRSDTALGAFYRRLRARVGAPKAITATAHKIAKIVYNMLKYGKAYVDRGAQYYEEQYRQRVVKSLHRRAEQLGFTLEPLAR
ncbi:MAG TPA: IS110 family transposase [Candidatus Tectomicrobia bacterium]